MKPIVFNYRQYEELREAYKALLEDNQKLMSDKEHLDKALKENLTRYHGFVTARSFSYYANITYYSARKQLDDWCKGENPRLLKSRRGQEYIYTET